MPKLKFATDAAQNKFYPISIAPGIIDTVRNQRLSVTIADIYSALLYYDVYVGAAATSAAVINSDYHYDEILKGHPIPISNTDGDYIWVILPATYSPTIQMGGLDVPMTLDSTFTIENRSYKIWKSSNTYTYSGTVNICIL